MILFRKKEDEDVERYTVELYVYKCDYCDKWFIGKTLKEVEVNALRHLKHKHNVNAGSITVQSNKLQVEYRRHVIKL
ncbi:MAG: hypothetical protein QXT64_05520 [Desulfurococcaceae archaeon]